MMKRFAGLAVTLGLAVFGPAAKADNVLYWMIDNPTIQSWYGVQYTAAQAGDRITDARVAMFATSSSEGLYQPTEVGGPLERTGDVIYLDLYYKDAGGKWVVTPEYELDSAQVTGGVLGDGADGYTYALASLDTTGISAGDLVNYSFAIELGAWDEDFSVWTLETVSRAVAYDSIQAFISDETSIPLEGIWSPEGYAVPEPTSGLLLVLGGALLALRRRREGVRG